VRSVHLALKWVGRALARFTLAVLALGVLCAFPAGAFFAAIWLGLFTADLVNAGVGAGIGMALPYGYFLAIYVYEPHVKAPSLRAAKALIDSLPKRQI
jgi:hypothetical protein